MSGSSRFFTGVSFVLIVLTLGVAQAQKKEIKIGFSIEAMNGERWQTDLEEFQQRAHELGGSVLTRSANGDDDLQFRQIKELLKSGEIKRYESLRLPRRNSRPCRRLHDEDSPEALAVLKENQNPQHASDQRRSDARRRHRQVEREDVVELRSK